MFVKTTVQQLPGTDDLYINIPESMFTDLGWDENTELVWVVAEDGTMVLKVPSDAS